MIKPILTSARVLVVDDDADVLRLHAAWLEAAGAVVTTGRSLGEGFAAAGQDRFDVALLDLDLPDGNGLELAAHLSATPVGTRVLMISAHTSPGQAAECLDRGAHGYLPKPVSRADLIDATRRASENARLRLVYESMLTRMSERVRALEQVLSVSREVITSHDPNSILHTSLDRLIRWLDAEGGSILLDRGDGRLVFAHAVGPGADGLLGTHVPVGKGIAGWVVENGRPLAVRDVTKDPRFCADPDATSGITTRSVLACPLRVRNRIIGVVELVNKHVGYFNRDDRIALETVAYPIAAAIDNAHTHSHLEARVQARTRSLEEANTQLREAKDQMVHAEKMASLGSIAAGVAHEINNPIGFVNSNLGSLGGYVDTLSALLARCKNGMTHEELTAAWTEGDIDFILEDLTMLLKESQDGIERVVKIVLDLKQFSHADPGQSEETDVGDCLQTALTLLQNELKYSMEVETDLGDVPRIQAYPAQLTQVFVNLIINAVHATESDSGKLTVSCSLANGFVVATVADNGPGIDPEVVSRIFDPFFTTKEPGKGTGLGLSISYEIIQRHHGDIQVTSEPGRGTTFTVRVPVDLNARLQAAQAS